MHMKENEDETAWIIEVGFYPGVLFGFRSYVEEYRTNHVLYLLFIDICLTIYKN